MCTLPDAIVQTAFYELLHEFHYLEKQQTNQSKKKNKNKY